MIKKGLAQIPLMIGLLIMAIAVPIATRLVQQNQDNRNLAACYVNYAGCSNNASCCSGVCQGICMPAPTTKPPTAKPPTAVPTKVPTAKPPTPITGPCNASTRGLCGIAGGCPIGQKCMGPIYTCINDSSCGGFIPTIMPTLYPTPNSCFATSGRPVNCFCDYNSHCNSGYCLSGICKYVPTATPTKRPPTLTPTPGPNTICATIPGQVCIQGSCASSGHTIGIGSCYYAGYNCCKLVFSTPTPKPPTPTPTKLPTATPTKRPTATPTRKPTSIPCATTGQACTTRSCCTTADVCTDEGLSYPVCVPRNQIPTYIPIPTIDCAKSGQGCSTRPCCEAYLDVCTDEGLSYPRCVPRGQIPTYIPVPTMMPCGATGGNCSSFLGCCKSTDKCTSGKCIALVPTGTNPTGTNPTSGPNPTSGGCSGSKPADKCNDAKTLFINAQCVNKQWDWNEQVCSVAGSKETCGGKNYCCPSAGGAWTTDMTNCIEVPPITCKVKIGDYTLNDFSIWRSEYIEGSFGSVSRNTWNADFDCDGKVTLNDFSVWRPNYFNDLLKN